MLKVGKVPENVLKRSVLKRLHLKNPMLKAKPGVGNDAAVLSVPEGMNISVTSKPVVIYNDIDIKRAFLGALNNISSAGGKCIAVEATILINEESQESDIKHITGYLDELAMDYDVVIAGGHTEVTDVVKNSVICVTGIGVVAKNAINSKGAKPGDDIVVTKWMALEGTSIIAKKKEDELKKRFSESFIDKAIDFSDLMSIEKEALIASKMGASAIHDASTGGIFGALWELGEASKCGLSVNMMEIPVKQETIEICEEYGLNPYELLSGGSLVITIPNGRNLITELGKEGINAKVIGTITDNNDKVVYVGDETRFLEPRRNEELYKLQ